MPKWSEPLYGLVFEVVRTIEIGTVFDSHMSKTYTKPSRSRRPPSLSLHRTHTHTHAHTHGIPVPSLLIKPLPTFPALSFPTSAKIVDASGYIILTLGLVLMLELELGWYF